MYKTPRKSILNIFLDKLIVADAVGSLFIEFEGQIVDNMIGLFKGSYVDQETLTEKQYLATYMRPNNARRLFPCFDEPRFKVPFTVTISRPSNYTTLFNTPIKSSESRGDLTIDTFETTPAMSTFTFGFVICELEKVSHTESNGLSPINIWAPKSDLVQMKEALRKSVAIMNSLQEYFDLKLPLTKIDIVGIPNISLIKPSDSWGLMLFRDSDLFKDAYFGIALEMMYQWLGCWVTPKWWIDDSINKALTSFLSARIASKLNENDEFNGKYPMTMLYSIYYELSKRYPYSRITAMKQESISHKIELIIRMIEFAIGEASFKNAVRTFVSDYRHKTFTKNDFWNYVSRQAQKDGILPDTYNVTEIANSWIAKDRLPVVTFSRNYNDNTASARQKVFLRERPHDVPDQDKMLWWIPLVIVNDDKCFLIDKKDVKWIPGKKDVVLQNVGEKNKFVIVNPEEIGPFLVNYDEQNWYFLATMLQSENGRKCIPPLTRAKLMHDAWNLAYAGDLSFEIAFNMTLFMRYERHHTVWNPVFTFIDHIGKKIELSRAHHNFESYVIKILSPLYESLTEMKEDDPNFNDDLKALAYTFLCRAGYQPCILESQKMYHKWMDSSNPNDFDLMDKQYLCALFKWGTIEEWEFGLQRVIQFPTTAVKSERTFLLKSLASCPLQEEKLYRLLNVTILNTDKQFSENDMFLILKMLSQNSAGYIVVLNFLDDNWNALRSQLQQSTNLWDSLIRAATAYFITEDGYNKVKQFRDKHSNEFGSAEHIIEKSLKTIKEESIWSAENFPIIELWLSNFLKNNQ